jgi:hypothetical protein
MYCCMGDFNKDFFDSTLSQLAMVCLGTDVSKGWLWLEMMLDANYVAPEHLIFMKFPLS